MRSDQPKLEISPVKKLEQPKQEVSLRNFDKIRTALMIEYGQKFPELAVGDTVKLYRHGTGINGKIAEITTTSVVLSEKNKIEEIQLTELDTDSRCQLDQVFRAQEIERAVQQRAATLLPQESTSAPISPATQQLPVKDIATLKLEEYQKKIEEAEILLEDVKKQCAQAKINYDMACTQYAQAQVQSQAQTQVQPRYSVQRKSIKTGQLMPVPQISIYNSKVNMDNKKNEYDSLTARIEKINMEINNYNQLISELKQK